MADAQSAQFHPNDQAKDRVQDYIDASAVAAFEEMSSPDGHPSITLKRRSKQSSLFINPANGALETSGQETSATYSWPGKDAHEAWRFSTSPGETRPAMLLIA
jgi:meiotic recombination protein SPO11